MKERPGPPGDVQGVLIPPSSPAGPSVVTSTATTALSPTGWTIFCFQRNFEGFFEVFT